MNSGPVRVERRAAQRFDFQLPLSLRWSNGEREGCGFTQDLSARGVFFYTDSPLSPGDPVEVVLVMPSEITLTENTRVRCHGRVVRVADPKVGSKSGVAVQIESYEYLPEAASAAEIARDFPRVSGLHEHAAEEEPAPSLHPLLS
ncbi:MAG TPA: PilZ domain-containing protein [Terriglobales bacterium]|nr:PilZ domain-containing protein [Terriglobales bacterium]